MPSINDAAHLPGFLLWNRRRFKWVAIGRNWVLHSWNGQFVTDVIVSDCDLLEDWIGVRYHWYASCVMRIIASSMWMFVVWYTEAFWRNPMPPPSAQTCESRRWRHHLLRNAKQGIIIEKITDFVFTGLRSLSHAYLHHRNIIFVVTECFVFVIVSAMCFLLSWYRGFVLRTSTCRGMNLTTPIPSNAEVRNEWKYSSTFEHNFFCIHGVHKDSKIFTFNNSGQLLP